MNEIVAAAHRTVEIVEFLCWHADGILQNLQSLSIYLLGLHTVFSFLRGLVNKSNHPVDWNQRVSRYQPLDMNKSVFPFEAWNFTIIQYFQLTRGEIVIRNKKHEICAWYHHTEFQPKQCYVSFRGRSSFLNWGPNSGIFLTDLWKLFQKV